jgi:cyanate lyase
LGQSEVFAAALFYGQARASPSDITTLSSLLSIPEPALRAALAGFPNRGSVAEMPPTEPFVYRLYEIVRNYGYVYKAVVNERFGDGIMSAVSFKTEVGREVDEKGAEWVVLTLRGKW